MNGADEVPGFVLARSWSRREQFGLGSDSGGGTTCSQRKAHHPALHSCPLDGSPRVADFHTCVQERQAAASPGSGRGHTALSCEDEVGMGKGRRGQGKVESQNGQSWMREGQI